MNDETTKNLVNGLPEQLRPLGSTIMEFAGNIRDDALEAAAWLAQEWGDDPSYLALAKAIRSLRGDKP